MMSGGVDSSVAAALVRDEGHDVTGVTLKLWGGESDSGCCSVSDVEDARRVAAQLDIPHYVFNFADDFDANVVEPYAAAYEAGETPNPCVECNRTMKFGRVLERAGSSATTRSRPGITRASSTPPAGSQSRAARDPAKDQSYVLYMLGRHELARTLLPVGELTKADVRAHARELGLRTAAKAESMDVCFITKGGRESFLGARIARRPGAIVDTRVAGRRRARRHRRVHDRAAARARVAVGDAPLRHRHRPRTATVTIGSAPTCCATASTSTRSWAAGVPADGMCSASGAPTATRCRAARRAPGRGSTSRRRGSRRAKWSRATTATSCSAAGSRRADASGRDAAVGGELSNASCRRARPITSVADERAAGAAARGGRT